VASDRRKSRTAGERSMGMYAVASLTALSMNYVLANPDTVDPIQEVGRMLSDALGAALGDPK